MGDDAGPFLQFLNHRFNFTDRHLRPPRQIAHFISHHCEPATRLPGTRGLNRRVQSQQVGLFCDRADDFQYVPDLLATALKISHLSFCSTNFFG
ncbi:hypothetical protein D3C75_765730 [compost metagenome]